jgi:hypothetical protein
MVIFYNEKRAQIKKYFLRDPYVPKSVNGIVSSIFPSIQVTQRGNFNINTNKTGRLDIKIDNMITTESFTFNIIGTGLLSINKGYINNFNGASIRFDPPILGQSSYNLNDTNNFTLVNQNYTCILTMNSSIQTEYNNRKKTIQDKIDIIIKADTLERRIVSQDYRIIQIHKRWHWTHPSGWIWTSSWIWNNNNINMININNGTRIHEPGILTDVADYGVWGVGI